MRNINALALFLAVLPIFAAFPAKASFLDWFIPPRMIDETRPYNEDGKIPHAQRWANDGWTPQSWIDGAGSVENVMHDLYVNDIITDQYKNWTRIPVLEVGQNFMNLSEQEKQHVVEFVDYAWDMTKNNENAIISVRFHKRDEHVGVYTRKEGLQLH